MKQKIEPLEHQTHPVVRFVALIFLVGLAVSLALFAWFSWLDRNEQSVANSSATEGLSQRTFTSQLVKLSFHHPADGAYTERDVFGQLNPAAKQGTKVVFRDSNNLYPLFEVATPDFVTSNEVPHDLIAGSLDSASSFTVRPGEGVTTKTRELRPGMYLVAFNASTVGLTTVPVYLVVQPPAESGLEYVAFYLEDNAETFDHATENIGTSEEFLPSDAAVERVLTLSTDPAHESLIKPLAQALAIAETLRATDPQE